MIELAGCSEIDFLMQIIASHLAEQIAQLVVIGPYGLQYDTAIFHANVEPIFDSELQRFQYRGG